MALYLARYLCQQGLAADRITILAAYVAQLNQLRIRSSRLNWPCLGHIHTTVVDNYQGEENDVIILSLVRNNQRNSVGFLKTANRVCVAL